MALIDFMLFGFKKNEKLRGLKNKIFNSIFNKKGKVDSLYTFPDATPEVLERIRLQMAIQNKEETIRYLISLVIILLLFVIIVL
ncbi:hypothetical protein KO494_06890 [Lacinutrix sp. C3R15]|uniref:hypothetical protein n=1 Tax=Flavobacteriaceae TaxID=49546 RepID=UPI001C098975|nr:MULTISPECIES: hypothetical protein [Flavobacteriaceae]MBU2939261.1 hypothetical protein [Lacinutrix sp. C3R15]MDO6622576.1 hypothetical protein [Oceanihabitans sp. 1_MG-2023]